MLRHEKRRKCCQGVLCSSKESANRTIRIHARTAAATFSRQAVPPHPALSVRMLVGKCCSDNAVFSHCGALVIQQQRPQ